MKVFIPSYGRPATIKTHRWLPPKLLPWKVVVADKSEFQVYSQRSDLKGNLLNSNTYYGVGKVRKWIMDNLVEENEWICMMDDNVEFITALDESGNETVGDGVHFWSWVEAHARMADDVGARLVGVAVVDNPFFRKKHYRDIGFVRGKIMLIKKTAGINFDPHLYSKEDYDFTAQNLAKFGRVLIDNWIYPVAKSYQAGGCGPKPVRAAADIEAAKILMQRYPFLYRYKFKESSAPDSEIQMCFTNLDQLEKWRVLYNGRTFS